MAGGLSFHHAIQANWKERIMTTKHATRALVLGALIAIGAAGCAHEHMTYAGNKQERSASQEVSDAALSARIKTAFATDDLVKAHDIKVDAMRGTITLTGAVKSAAERDKAISIARNTKGVISVTDNIKVTG
jgi:hyperosmotically inducible protein